MKMGPEHSRVSINLSGGEGDHYKTTPILFIAKIMRYIPLSVDFKEVHITSCHFYVEGENHCCDDLVCNGIGFSWLGSGEPIESKEAPHLYNLISILSELDTIMNFSVAMEYEKDCV